MSSFLKLMYDCAMQALLSLHGSASSSIELMMHSESRLH